MAISDPGRGLVRRLGVTAAALFAFAAASQQRAEALSLASPGTAPSAKFATDDLTTEVRHGGHGGGGGGFPRRWRRWLSRRRWWRFPRRRVSWRWIQRRRCRVPWRRVQRRWRCDPSWRLSRRARVPRRRHALRIPSRLSPAALLTTGITSIGASIAPSYYGVSRLLLWLPAPLLPRDLDLLRAAQDLPLSSLASAPLRHYGYPDPLLVRAKMKQAPGRAPVFIELQRNAACSIPILAAPGLDLPRRHRLHPPLFPVLRRPMAETRGFLGRCREIDDARHRSAPRLGRRLADHIDEFRLVRHGRLPREELFARDHSAPRALTRRFQNASLSRQRRVNATPGCRRNARRSPRPPPWPATPDGCGP